MIHETIKIEVPYEKYGCKKSSTTATLTTYVLRDWQNHDIARMRPAVIICPGGGYEHVSEREAEPVAIRYNAMGYHAFILDYSVVPDSYPAALLEMAKAVAIIREKADEWHIDKEKVVASGFSAGGHLAAAMGVFWNQKWLADAIQVSNEQIKINGLILCYPVISSGEFAHRGSFTCLLGDKYEELVVQMSIEHAVSKDTPKTFLWHTMTDETVPVENSLMFLNACHKNGISVEAHLFPEGRHGMSLCNEETSVKPDGSDIKEECQIWIQMAGKWLSKL